MTTFEVLAEPTRRRILDLLSTDEHPVGEIVRTLEISQPLASKHLRVLREAGLVSVRVQAQQRCYSLDPRPLAEVDAWLARYRPFWTERLDALVSHLNEEEES